MLGSLLKGSVFVRSGMWPYPIPGGILNHVNLYIYKQCVCLHTSSMNNVIVSIEPLAHSTPSIRMSIPTAYAFGIHKI